MAKTYSPEKYQERKDAIREAQRRYNEKNKERFVEKQRQYDSENRERINRRMRDKRALSQSKGTLPTRIELSD